VNVTYFSVIHLGALAAPFLFSWRALGVAFVLYWLSASIGICLTYHRLLTHRGFKVGKPLEYLLTVCGMLASEGGAISWVAMHRVHHTLSDRPGKDLHTPKDGFWWSHWGWIVTRLGVDYRELEARHAPELVADPVHRVLNRLHIFPNIIVAQPFAGALVLRGVGVFSAWGRPEPTWFHQPAPNTFATAPKGYP
jgi:stearoyl-CoA desaturase (delta-9 desaturase)